MKCIWCNKLCEPKIALESNGETYACCSEECKQKAEKFLCSAKRLAYLFLVLFTACWIGVIVTSFAAPHYATLCVSGMGTVLLFLPLCTPQTVQAVGLSKSFLIGRCLGILLIALGFFHFSESYLKSNVGLISFLWRTKWAPAFFKHGNVLTLARTCV